MAGDTRSRLRALVRSSVLRLALLLSVVFACGMAVAVMVALSLGREEIAERADVTLETVAQAALVEEGATDSPTLILREADDLEDLPRAFRRVAAQGGGTVRLEDDVLDAEIWRVLISEDSAGEPVLVALPLDDSDEAQEVLAGVLWTMAGLMILASLVLGVGAGLLAQRRVGRIEATLQRLGAGDLAARTGIGRDRDDLDDIARNLDSTAGALEVLVAQTRSLSASIAHDLRTPLARLRARLESLPEEQGRDAALAEAERLSEIFDTIMRIARIEAGQGRGAFAPVDLGELAQDLGETFSPVVEDAGKGLRVRVQGAGTVHADRQMLVQAVANLIQNALIHGGAQITLQVSGSCIGILDDGPGVDPAHHAEILKPMVRLDAARSSEGHGLGLALVRAVAERHGAKLVIARTEAGLFGVSLNFAEL